MSTGSAVDQEALDRDLLFQPGRFAGRLVDGVDLVIDGIPSGRMPPRWVRGLEGLGYNASVDPPIWFEIRRTAHPIERFDAIRDVLRRALALVEAGADPHDVRVIARGGDRLGVLVVKGRQLIGFALGALEDPPITLIEGPAWLPPYPPGEDPAEADPPARAAR